MKLYNFVDTKGKVIAQTTNRDEALAYQAVAKTDGIKMETSTTDKAISTLPKQTQ